MASVRHHVEVQATRELPANVQRRAVCAPRRFRPRADDGPESVGEVAQLVAPQAQLDEVLVVRGARKIEEQLVAAAARG